jgi:hypothetical protein
LKGQEGQVTKVFDGKERAVKLWLVFGFAAPNQNSKLKTFTSTSLTAHIKSPLPFS